MFLYIGATDCRTYNRPARQWLPIVAETVRDYWEIEKSKKDHRTTQYILGLSTRNQRQKSRNLGLSKEKKKKKGMPLS